MSDTHEVGSSTLPRSTILTSLENGPLSLTKLGSAVGSKAEAALELVELLRLGEVSHVGSRSDYQYVLSSYCEGVRVSDRRVSRIVWVNRLP